MSISFNDTSISASSSASAMDLFSISGAVSTCDLIARWSKIMELIGSTFQKWHGPDVKTIPVDGRIFNEKIEVNKKIKSEIMKEINDQRDVCFTFHNLIKSIDNDYKKRSYYDVVYKWTLAQAKQSVSSETQAFCLSKLYDVTNALLHMDERNAYFMISRLIRELALDTDANVFECYFYLDQTLNIIVNKVYCDLIVRNAMYGNLTTEIEDLKANLYLKDKLLAELMWKLVEQPAQTRAYL